EAGKPKHAGIGERIAQQSLQRCARKTKGSADQPSGQSARKPDLPDYGAGFVVAGERMAERHGTQAERSEKHKRAGDGQHEREARSFVHGWRNAAAIASAASIAYQASHDTAAAGSATVRVRASAARNAGWREGDHAFICVRPVSKKAVATRAG